MDEITPISFTSPHEGRAKHPYDQKRAEAAVLELLIALGEDPEREGLRDTPARVARAMQENFSGLWSSPEEVLTTTFDAGHRELIIVRDIEVFSHCEHHLTPFHGVAHIGYIPGESGRITGLSKLARLVDLFAKRPQVQERLTMQIAKELQKELGTEDVAIVIDAKHLCVASRGVEDDTSSTITSFYGGKFKEEKRKEEFLRYLELKTEF